MTHQGKGDEGRCFSVRSQVHREETCSFYPLVPAVLERVTRELGVGVQSEGVRGQGDALRGRGEESKRDESNGWRFTGCEDGSGWGVDWRHVTLHWRSSVGGAGV